MKKYREFMNGVKAPDTLRQRLRELKTPEKRPEPWVKYGTMAAALVLALGLGSWGLDRYSAWGEEQFRCAVRAESEAVGQFDIAAVEPGDWGVPAKRTPGGYDVTTGSGENAMVTHYILPYIEYGTPKAEVRVALDWDIPKEATRRDLTQDEIIALIGGEDAVNTHLDWGGYELTGWAAWCEDSSFWGAYFYGYAGPLDHFEFAVTAGQLPPTCIAFPERVTQEIRGLTVTADGHDSVATPSGGVDASSRRVSFMKDDYGYRFDLTGTSKALTEERVSRLVCRVADKGLALSAVDPTAPAETYICTVCGNAFPAGTEHFHPFAGVGEPNWEDIAPPVSVSADPEDGMCEGYPMPEGGVTCPICGQTLPAGMEHSHEVCGYPLASPGTAAETIYD